jgi:hypothetical protein
MAYGWPCAPNTRISQNFGGNPASYQPDGHTGIDFALPVGSDLFAIGDGVVKHADWADNLKSNPYLMATTQNAGFHGGIIVIIDHGDIVTTYSHLNETHLNAGDRVSQGQLIGKSGNTGFSSGPHLHFEVLVDGWNVRGRWFGRSDPLKWINKVVTPPAASLSASQRVVGADGAKYRPEPNTSKEETQLFKPGDVLNFNGWIHGQNVPFADGSGSNDIWLRGINGGWVWIGGLSPMTESGLADLNPKPAPKPANPAERTIGSVPTNQRSEPSTKGGLSTVTGSLDAGFTFTASGWVKGDAPKDETNRIWFVGKNSGNFVWSGACTDPSIGSLPDLSKKETPAPVTPAPPVYVPPVVKPAPVTPTPAPPPVVVAPVLKAEVDVVTGVFPAHTDNYMMGNIPKFPTKIAVHQYGAKGIKQTSVTRYFQMSLEDRLKSDSKAGVSSSHFNVEKESCLQHVSIFDRAYHAGKVGNDFWSVETSPDQDDATIETTRRLIRALNDLVGYELEVVLHKDIPGNATKCGNDIDLSRYQNVGLTPKPTTTDKTTKEELLAKVKEFTTLIERL